MQQKFIEVSTDDGSVHYWINPSEIKVISASEGKLIGHSVTRNEGN